jgi:uncharacterized protein involved in exopolysaccharide biosynthesis
MAGATGPKSYFSGPLSPGMALNVHPSPQAPRPAQPTLDLVPYVRRHWKLVLGVTVLGVLGGLVAAVLMTPMYRSEVVLFPTLTNSVSKALLADQRTTGDDLMAVGEEKDLEHLLQMLRSVTIRERTVERFDLYTVYGIDEEVEYPKAELIGIFDDQVTFRKTRFNSVEVEVLDQDPERAAGMANFICDQVDTVWREMQHQRLNSALELLDAQLEISKVELHGLTDSLRALQRLGVHDYESQAERFNEYIGAAIVKNDQRALKELEERFAGLSEIGGPYIVLSEQVIKWSWRINELRAKRDLVRAELDSRVPFKFVVDRAQVMDKPARPIRWLVVLIGGLSGLILALCLLIIQTNLSKLSSQHGR